MNKSDFVALYGGVFEHSPFLAERAFDAGLVEEPLTAGGVHAALTRMFRAAGPEERLGVLKAHPDLAGKLAIAGDLTDDSRREQAGAGLDRLSEDEYARFNVLNATYGRKFGFPFIIAVKGLSKTDILAAFEHRIDNTANAEFDTACAEVEKIASLRLKSLLPETA